MLQERLDSVTDELNTLQKYVNDIAPPSYKQFPQLDNHMSVYKNELMAQEKHCFVRMYINGSNKINDIIQTIKDHPDVEDIVYYTNKAEEIFCKEYRNVMILLSQVEDDETCDYTFYDENVYIIQAFISFRYRIYNTKFMAVLYNQFRDDLYIHVSNVDESEKTIVVLPLNNNETDLITFIEYYMAAGTKKENITTVKLDNIPFQSKETSGLRGALYCQTDDDYKTFCQGIEFIIDEAYSNDLQEFKPLLPADLTAKHLP